jgi:ATP-dependent RNA helicase DeaD
MKIVQQRFSKKTIPLSNTTDVGLVSQNWNRKQPLWIAYFTINRYKCYCCSSRYFGSYTRTRASIFRNLEQFATYIPNISIAATCGGIPIKPQIERLALPTHIVVATPGRLIDLIQRKAINLKKLNSSCSMKPMKWLPFLKKV